MDSQSIEQTIWDRLSGIKMWESIASPFMKEDFPSLGKLPSAIALSVGNAEILFASGEVTEVAGANGFQVFQVAVTFVASNGIHRASITVGRQTNENPIVHWAPLSLVTSASLISDKSNWSENKHSYTATLKLHIGIDRVEELVPGFKGFNTSDELIAAYRVIQSQFGS